MNNAVFIKKEKDESLTELEVETGIKIKQESTFDGESETENEWKGPACEINVKEENEVYVKEERTILFEDDKHLNNGDSASILGLKEGDGDLDPIDVAETVLHCRTKVPPKRKKFRDAWLNHEHFRGWLARVQDDPYKAQCIICHSVFLADITSVKRHRTSRMHERSESGASDNPVTKAEIKLARFLAQNNVPLSTADRLVDLLKEIFPDSEILQECFPK